MPMKVLIADAFSKEHIKDIQALGLEVDYRPDLPAKELAANVSGVSVLIVRSKQVAADVFDHGHALSLVIRAGAGVNTIDVNAASARGVYVANCPGQNAIAVAELAIGLMISLDRRIADNVVSLRNGQWQKKAFSESRGLFGRTIGIVGLGSIGLETARRAQALGMRVLAWSRSLSELKARTLGFERARDVKEIFATADVVSLHLPLAKDLKGFIGKELLESMKPGATFINTARADLVDQAALLELAKAGKIKIGLDVYAGEPEGGKAEFHSELAKLPNVYGTHHIGASTEQAQDAIATEAVRIVTMFVREGSVPNCVNVARKTPARCQLIVRHHDKVGVLANVLDAIRQAGINAQEVENTIFEGAAAACCKIQLDHRPEVPTLDVIRKNGDVIFVDCVDL